MGTPEPHPSAASEVLLLGKQSREEDATPHMSRTAWIKTVCAGKLWKLCASFTKATGYSSRKRKRERGLRSFEGYESWKPTSGPLDLHLLYDSRRMDRVRLHIQPSTVCVIFWFICQSWKSLNISTNHGHRSWLIRYIKITWITFTWETFFLSGNVSLKPGSCN